VALTNCLDDGARGADQPRISSSSNSHCHYLPTALLLLVVLLVLTHGITGTNRQTLAAAAAGVSRHIFHSLIQVYLLNFS